MDFSKIMSDPEIMAAMQNPKMMQVFMDMQQQGPMAIMKYQNDPGDGCLAPRLCDCVVCRCAREGGWGRGVINFRAVSDSRNV